MQPKPLYKVRVTTVEKYRQYIADQVTEDALYEYISGEFKGNDFTRVGSAFHRMIEKPEQITRLKYQRKNWMIIRTEESTVPFMFPEAVGQIAVNYRGQHPKMFCEVPVTKVYDLGHCQVQVFGKIDGLEGFTIHDQKVIFFDRNDSDFMDSCQWMFYSDMVSGVREFQFRQYQVEGFEKLGSVCDHGWMLKNIKMVALDPIILFPYPEMYNSLTYLLREFVEYIDFRNIHHHLQRPIPYEAEIN